MTRAMEGALNDAKLTAQDIQYVNAHGTGTAANDVAETQALHQVFGEHARKLAVSSTKSMIGHALGAAGALEMVATLLAIRDAIVPPTIGYLGPIRPAISTTCRTRRARCRSTPRCRTRLPSAGSTPCWR